MSELISTSMIILLLLVVNGLFAMSEIAVVSARTIRLQRMAQAGNRGATAALELADNPNRFLSTVQVGITLVGIFAGAYGGANIAAVLAAWLSELGWIGRYAESISLFVVVGTITFLSVVIGELVPKRVALGNAERIAALVSRPMRFVSIVASPAVRLLSIATEVTLRLLGIQMAEEESIDEEEIRMMVQQGAEAGTIEEAQRDMVASVFRLAERPLKSMMTPRPEVVWLDVNASDEELRGTIRGSSNAYFPVCDGNLDKVLGVVQARDLLFDWLEGRAADMTNAMEEPLLVPEALPAIEALERFRQSGRNIALVFDEYGGIEGLVDLFDVLEAIVGDIPTQSEIVEPPVVRRDDGSWLVDGLIPIDDFKEALAVEPLPGEGDYQTLAGFVISMLGAVPKEGDHFDCGLFRYEIVDMDRYRVDKVLLTPLPHNE
jgi:putative hemolysin